MMRLSEYIVHVHAERLCVACDAPDHVYNHSEIIYEIQFKKKKIHYISIPASYFLCGVSIAHKTSDQQDLRIF